MTVWKQLCSPLSLSLFFSLSVCQVRVQTNNKRRENEWIFPSYSRRFLISVVKSQGRSRDILVVFWSPPRISFFRLFLFVRCPGVLPRRLEISLDWLFWVQTKNHAVAVFTLYRTSTHLKKWLLSLPRYEFTFVFYSKRARCISHSSRSFMRARADVFFSFCRG